MITGFDPLAQRYPSQRFPIYARGGMVNCSCPQAAAAGLEILRSGGNAMDAAVAAAAVLTVAEPTANGIGGDAFALIWSGRDHRLYGLNASGPAPRAISIRDVLDNGRDDHGRMPAWGWVPVMVPGIPKAWAAISGRFGKLPLPKSLEPAVRYARDGYPCAPNIAFAWRQAFARYKKELSGPCFDAWFDTFAPHGRAPEAGETVTLPDHADTLEAIGETRAEAFYTGDLARRIDACSRKYGGYLRYEDLAAFEAQWVEPVSVDYRGFTVCEIPPNGQGVAALAALNILKEFSFTVRDCPETMHRQIEAMKMAFADVLDTVTDPEHMKIDPMALLDPAYGARRAREMGDTAGKWTLSLPPRGGTVYLCCADGEGNMVSYIQSNYRGFGSGIVVEGTGIALQDRGAFFSLDPEAANCLAPGKRTYHTIMPGFLMKDGGPVGPFGVMGGTMQPQGHVQVVTNLIDFSMDPQQALDAPRWQWMRDGTVTVESRFDPDLARALRRMGHDVRVDLNTPAFGRGQVILRLDGGVLAGGTESRADSNIACW